MQYPNVFPSFLAGCIVLQEEHKELKIQYNTKVEELEKLQLTAKENVSKLILPIEIVGSLLRAWLLETLESCFWLS